MLSLLSLVYILWGSQADREPLFTPWLQSLKGKEWVVFAHRIVFISYFRHFSGGEGVNSAIGRLRIAIKPFIFWPKITGMREARMEFKYSKARVMARQEKCAHLCC